MSTSKSEILMYGTIAAATCAALALSAWTSTVLAADTAVAKTSPVSVVEPMSSGNLLQLTFGLVLVLGAILGSAWLLRRYGRLQTGVSGALRILGGLSLGPRERMVLVQVGENQLLVGVAPGRVQTLHVLDKPVTVSDTPANAGDSFAARLGAALKQQAGRS